MAQTIAYLDKPYFGNASYLVVPAGCRATLYDVAPIGSGGHTRTFGPGEYNLQAEKREGPAGSWEIYPGTCEGNLKYCWSDHVVAVARQS